MKAVQIKNTHFETGDFGISQPKFHAGQVYPLSAETERQVALGNGELVDVPDEPDQAQGTPSAGEAATPTDAAGQAAASSAADAGGAAAATPEGGDAAAKQQPRGTKKVAAAEADKPAAQG